MKNKIALKLSGYFTFALIIFSIVVGIVFITLFRQHTINIHKSELERRALSISEDLLLFYEDECVGSCETEHITDTEELNKNGYGAYLRFIDRIAMCDVWIINKSHEIITRGHKMSISYNYSDLPKNAEDIIKTVFEGETILSENFSTILNAPTLTVGVPIKSKSHHEDIIGVVLLHSPVENSNQALNQGIILLVISISIAFIISIILSICFSITFTKPLNKMKTTAINLSVGNYAVKTNVSQNDEIGELAQTIDILSLKLLDASNESKKLEQIRRDFVANISHELKTPITIIRGSLEALYDGVVTEVAQVQNYYEQMLEETKGLQRLVTDLLDLSKLQNADFSIEMETVNLYDIINDIVRSMNKLAEQKNITINIENTTNNCNVIGDYGRLRQMFIIVLDNAIKFSPQNSNIYIKIYKKDKLFVSVYDEGKNIPKEDLPYIFDRFFKTKSSENKNGTGLGLAIAKQIAIRHNVEINVISDMDKGCEFIFLFPIQ